MEAGNKLMEEALDVANIFQNHLELRSLIELILTKQDRQRLEKLINSKIMEDELSPASR